LNPKLKDPDEAYTRGMKAGILLLGEVYGKQARAKELVAAIEKNRGKWGLGLEVLDSHTGGVRGPDSLSGGEKFQASLALALGLAEVVTNRAGGMRLDTLFIDEGFGSLDAETLDVTMATLDNLREGGRTVGLISHVASMKESIPAQLSVEKVPGGWSVIRQESSS
jgi:exonuclease SbcC